MIWVCCQCCRGSGCFGFLFLLSLYFTYWCRKHVNFCQVVFLLLIHYVTCWLTFVLLTLGIGHTWRITWSTLTSSLKILYHCVHELWVIMSLMGLCWRCICSCCIRAVSRDRCIRQFFPTFLKLWPWYVSSRCIFCGCVININPVVCQNSVWPCVEHHRAVCAWAKSWKLRTRP